MRFPWTQANPAELSFTVLVPTDHVVAATIFLNGHVAFWTLLSAGRIRSVRLRKYKNIYKNAIQKFTLTG